MKRVLFSTEETIHQKDLTNKSHVGFVSKDGSMGYIIHNDNNFTAISASESMGNCNWSYEVFGKSIQDVLQSLASHKDVRKRIVEVFQFEKRLELYEWLTKMGI